MADVTELRCPCCRSDGSSRDSVRVDGRSWRACTGCGLLFLDPMPSAAELEALYASYWDRARPALRVDRARVASEAGHVGDPLTRFLMQTCGRMPARVLDVGCGHGARLARVRALGATTVRGTELDASAAAWARSEHGLDVRVGTIDACVPEPGGFDAVILSEVIEHVLDPVELLSRAAALLAPGGRVFLSTPNSAVRARCGSAWDGLSRDLEHVVLFDDRSMRAALGRAGLVASEILTWGRPSVPAAPVSSRVAGALARASRVARRVGRAVVAQPQLLDAADGYTLYVAATRMRA